MAINTIHITAPASEHRLIRDMRELFTTHGDVSFLHPELNVVIHKQPVGHQGGITSPKKQGIQLVFEGNVAEEVADRLAKEYENINGIYADSYLRYSDDTLGNGEADTTLFRHTFSYYNLDIPDYVNSTVDSNELSLPMFMAGVYYREHPTNRALRIYINDNEEFKPMLQGKKMVRKFPSSVNNNNKIFNTHRRYRYGLNYFMEYTKLGGKDSDPLRERKKNVYVTFPFNTEINNYTYDVPYYTSVKMPWANDMGHKIKDIFAETGFMELMFRTTQAQPGNMIRAKDGTQYKSWDALSLLSNPNGYQSLVNQGDSLSMDLPESKEERLKAQDYSGLEWLDARDKFLITMTDFLNQHALDLNRFLGSTTTGKNYDELLGFRVEKRLADASPGSTPMQVFYFFNRGNMKRFVDTQIKHNVEYSYAVFSYYGMVYNQVKTTAAEKIDTQTSRLYLEIQPRLRIVEARTADYTTIAIEPPPIVPEVRFENSKMKDHEIRINIRHQPGRRLHRRDRRPMREISDSDNIYKQKLITYNQGNEETYFSSVAASGEYEVYKLDYKPSSIEDFSGNLVKTVSMPGRNSRGQRRAKNVISKDRLAHGKKYYYLLRALTEYGNFSNPTPIYEVEKIKDADETILKVNVLRFEQPDFESTERNFRRFMKISIAPDHLQMITAPSNTAKNSYYILGSQSNKDSVWKYNDLEKHFIKLRLESKNTGKKIDLNLIFKYLQPEK